jgi:hypothetical protein
MIIRSIIFFFLCFFSLHHSFAWGFWGHKQINKMAVFTLPPELFPLYKKNIDFIIEQAVTADKRRYTNKKEAPRHYIDLDHYGLEPFSVVPKSWKNAVAKFTEDTLQAYGIVPWHIQVMLYSLTEAFRKKDLNEILNYSANIGHYIADAHVPLHTTENYNGQLSNQHGIHGFWESRIPEMIGDKFDYIVGSAELINDPLNRTWQIIKESHSAVDSVLDFELILNDSIASDRKFSFEQKGNQMVKVYSKEYSLAYNKMLNGMIERRMKAAISAVGAFWYTAWINAGQPDLKKLYSKKGYLNENEEESELEKNQIKGHSE